MEYSVEKIGSNKVKIKFESTVEEFSESVQKAYQKGKGKIAVPGFRPGKAPRKVIERMYGKGVFYEDALDLLFPDAYVEAIEKNDLQVVDRPELKSIDQMEEGKPLIFTCEVFVVPEVKLGEYKGVKIHKEDRTATDEDVDARLEQERNKVARAVEVTDRKLEDGDIARLDYSGSVDGVKFDGGTAEDQTLTIGSGSFIPGFEQQMIGMEIGEEKDLNVTFPEKYHSEELAGKEAVFHVKLLGIEKEELPALDDDFASEVSEYDTLAEFRAALLKEIQDGYDAESKREAENELLEKVCEACEAEIPDAMVEDRLDDMMRQMEYNMSRQGYKMEFYLKIMNKTKDELREMYRTQAKDEVKKELVLAAIAKAEAVEATDEEVDKQLAEYAEGMKETVENLKASLSPRALESVKDGIRANKVVDLLLDAAVITDEDDDEEPEA